MAIGELRYEGADDAQPESRSVFHPENGSQSGSGVRSVVAARVGKVLLADAHDDWLNFIAHVLRRRGHEVFCVTTAEAGHAVLAEGAPDVLVSGLTDAAGLRLVWASKRRPNQDVRTILLCRDGSELRGLPRGTVDMPLLRPVPIASLLETIESFLSSTHESLG